MTSKSLQLIYPGVGQMILFAVLVLTSYIPFISVQVLVVTHQLVVHAPLSYFHRLRMDSGMHPCLVT